MKILVDMDGVLAWLEESFDKIWRERYPQLPQLNREKRREFFLDDELGCGMYRSLVYRIIAEKGFFLNLPEVPGAAEGFCKLAAKYDVYICTTPLTDYKNCVLEKYQWVEQHLGFEWTKKIILTKDKWLINADYLIDDTPNLAGTNSHTWKQILFETPHSHYHKSKAENWATISEKL